MRRHSLFLIVLMTFFIRLPSQGPPVDGVHARRDEPKVLVGQLVGVALVLLGRHGLGVGGGHAHVHVVGPALVAGAAAVPDR